MHYYVERNLCEAATFQGNIPLQKLIVFPIQNQGKEILKIQQTKLFSIDICLTL